MRSVVIIGPKVFEEVGAEMFYGLLNHLHIGAEETDAPMEWSPMLVDTVKSPEGRRQLAVQSWEFLVKLATLHTWKLSGTTYPPHVTPSLLKSQEWDKLECWMGVVWMAWPPETDKEPEDLKFTMESLFRERPGALRKLTQWMEQRAEHQKKFGLDCAVPASFQRICKQAHEAAL